MPKQKTHKGLSKRVKLTRRGKIKRRRSFAGHLMSGKSGNRRRRMRRPAGVLGVFARKVRTALAR